MFCLTSSLLQAQEQQALVVQAVTMTISAVLTFPGSKVTDNEAILRVVQYMEVLMENFASGNIALTAQLPLGRVTFRLKCLSILLSSTEFFLIFSG